MMMMMMMMRMVMVMQRKRERISLILLHYTCFSTAAQYTHGKIAAEFKKQLHDLLRNFIMAFFLS
jgi:hypothetical protein